MKLAVENITPYLPRLLEVSLNNAIIPCYWENATLIPMYKGGNQSAFSDYRSTRLTSML